MPMPAASSARGISTTGTTCASNVSVVFAHAVEAAAEHHAARFLDPRDLALAVDPRRQRARELALRDALASIGVVAAHELVDLGERRAARTASEAAARPRRRR